MAIHKDLPRFRLRILLPLGSILLVAVIFAIASVYFLQRHHLEDGVRRQLDSVPQLFAGLLDNEARHIGNLLDSTMLDQELTTAFARGDRRALEIKARHHFERLRRQSDITHFYFILPDRHCFLRVHNPAYHSDLIERFTLSAAAEQRRQASGIELGPFGTFTLRVVMPLLDGERLLGFVEFGRDIEYLMPDLKRFLGMEFFVLVNKRYLERARWEEGRRMLGGEGLWDQVPGHVLMHQTMAELPSRLGRYMELSHEEKKKLVMKMLLGQATMWGGFAPLRDAGGREVGEIVALQDVTAHVVEQYAAGVLALAGGLVVGLLFVFFYFHVRRMEHGLRQAHGELARHQEDLEGLVAERTRELLLYRQIVDATRDLMAYVDREYVYRAVNAEYSRLLGGRSEEIVGRSVSAVRGEELFRSAFKEPLDRALAGEQVRYERWFTFADGVPRYLDVTYTPFRRDGQLPEGVVISTRDITARKEAQDGLERVNAELEERVVERTAELQATYRQLLHAEKLNAVGKIAASVAHELTNPICGISNVLEGIRKRVAMDQENLTMVELAARECQRVTRLLADMQGFNRPTTGARRPVDLHPLLDAMLRLCDKECRRHRIRVVREYADHLPPILAVEDQLKQVVLNLVNNAVAAMEGEGGTLTLQTGVEGEQVVVRVQDTGVGIRPEHLAQVFEPFFTTKAMGKGTGLGLSVSLGIIEQHGGTLAVQSEAGQGAIFTITLPAAGILAV